MSTATARSVEIAIGAGKYVMSSDDEYLSGLGQRFEPQTVRLLSTLFSPESVVLDIGANIGCTSILFGQRARRVVAFEPSPSTFAFLRTNVTRSGLANVELRNHALGATPGRSQLTFAETNRAGGFVSPGTPTSVGHVTEEISVMRLDDVVASLSLDAIDLIKIDVEGFELSVLEGGRATIGRFQPIVALELNHWCLNAFQRTSVPDFLDYLRSVFPILYAIQAHNYQDLHDASESYIVMYRHILQSQYATLVGAFDEEQMKQFHLMYAHGVDG